jgi:hypothetical protein
MCSPGLGGSGGGYSSSDGGGGCIALYVNKLATTSLQEAVYEGEEGLVSVPALMSEEVVAASQSITELICFGLPE